MTVHWFGKSWGAPICEEGIPMKTPVGKLCEKPLAEEDQGLGIPFADPEGWEESTAHESFPGIPLR